MRNHSNLVRKQFLVSEDNVQKIDQIASDKGTSSAEIVRQAIDAYDPDRDDNTESSDLLELVSITLKEAISSTQKANQKMDKTLKKLGSD